MFRLKIRSAENDGTQETEQTQTAAYTNLSTQCHFLAQRNKGIKLTHYPHFLL